MSKGSVALLIGVFCALSACSTIRDITGDSPPKTDAERAAAKAKQASEQAATVAALVKTLHEPQATKWTWHTEATGWSFGPPDADARPEAAWALGHQFKSYSAIPELALALKDADQRVRCNAAASLWAMADQASPAQAALEGALNDSYSRVRLNAARALWTMGVPAAGLMPALNGVAAGPELFDAVAAADLLIAMGKPPRDLVPVLMRGMADPEVSETVIANLAERHEDPAYLPVLRAGADSANAEVRAQSLTLLGASSYATPEVAALLMQASSDSLGGIRASAAQALVVGGTMSDEAGKVAGTGTGAGNETIAQLLKLVHDRDAGVRSVAAESLGRAKDSSPEVIAALRACLKDRDLNVREAAIKAFEAIGKPAAAAVPHLWVIWNDGRKKQASDDDQIVGSDAETALYWGMGEDVEVSVPGWYDAEWGMNPAQVQAAFAKHGVAIARWGAPPGVLGIERLDCGCGQSARCKWACSLSSPAASASEAAIPVSVAFVFDPSGLLSKVLLESHVGNASRCRDLGNILAGLEWTYSTSHTKSQVPSPGATVWSYGWSLTSSSLTYQTETTPSACEMELAYASSGTLHAMQ